MWHGEAKYRGEWYIITHIQTVMHSGYVSQRFSVLWNNNLFIFVSIQYTFTNPNAINN